MFYLFKSGQCTISTDHKPAVAKTTSRVALMISGNSP